MTEAFVNVRSSKFVTHCLLFCFRPISAARFAASWRSEGLVVAATTDMTPVSWFAEPVLMFRQPRCVPNTALTFSNTNAATAAL